MTRSAHLGALLAASLMLGITGCTSTPRVATDFDPAADFSGYHIYSWVRSGVPTGNNPLLYDRVMRAVEAELAARGYVKGEPADFAVDVTLGARDRIETTNYGAYGPYYPAYGRGYRWGWAPHYSQVDIRTVRDGTMAIDVYDARTHRPVWQGRATKEVNGDLVDSTVINGAVKAVLDRFPPGSK